MEPLITSLLDLLHELEGRNLPITVGGGFGLYLKRRHLDSTGQQTLFDRLPEPRSTNDLDLFLPTEILVDLSRTRQISEAILRLGYRAVEAAKYLQWEREVLVAGVPQRMKIDILVGPLGEARKTLNVSMPRVRPKGDIKFHAHAVEEAIDIEADVMPLAVTGRRSTGEPYGGTVFIPGAFPYLMMKLHAFDDRRLKGQQDKQRQHALDLYSIVGMMTEAEYNRARATGAASAENEHVRRSRNIVRDQFASPTAVGVLRFREHALYREGFQVQDFLEVLREIFPRA